MLGEFSIYHQIKQIFSNTLQKYCDFIIALFGGIATSLAVEPVSCFLFAWMSLAILWFLILKNCKYQSVGKIILLASFWGYAYHGLSLSWILNFHPLTWMGIPWIPSLVFAIAFWLITSSLGAIFVTIWASGLRFVIKHKYHVSTQILAGSALWVGLEWLFRQSPFWWTSLSLTQSPHNLWFLQLNQISGAETSVAIIVAVNGLLANAFWFSYQKSNLNFRNQLNRVAIYIVMVTHSLGASIYFFPNLKTESIYIGIIQGDIPLEIKFEKAGLDLAFNRYFEGYKVLRNKKVDAVLTPEIAMPKLGFSLDLVNTSFGQLIQQSKIPFWIGTRTGERQHPQQSLIALEETGVTSQYNKQKLVLFGEYIPFAKTRLEPLIKKLFPFKVNHLAGAKEQKFNTPFGKAAVVICYESAFPEIVLNQVKMGGKFIIVATADGLFGEFMMQQHHAQDVLRAIETRRWLVRANSRNYSGVIDSKGNTMWISQPGYITKKAKIYLSDRQTLYTRWGNWLTPALIFLSLYKLRKRLKHT